MTRRNLMYASMVGAMLAMATSAASAQSMKPTWCNDQASKNATERTICATSSLWVLDDELNMGYAFAMDQLPASQKALLKSSQANWLQETRNACGADVGCLQRVYKERDGALSDIQNRKHM